MWSFGMELGEQSFDLTISLFPDEMIISNIEKE
jgi:hypothetical protein